MRAAAAVLGGHLLAALVGGLALAGLMMRDRFWQGLSAFEVLILAVGLSVSVLVLAAPGWLLLRLAVIRPLLQRSRGRALALFMGCQAINAVGALLVVTATGGGRLGSDGRQAFLGVVVFLGIGAVAGAAAWVGERLVTGLRRFDGAKA